MIRALSSRHPVAFLAIPAALGLTIAAALWGLAWLWDREACGFALVTGGDD